MHVTSELAKYRPERGTILTVGVFDGVHLGHRQFMGRLTREAAERHLISGVVTFTHHPRALLSPESRLARLISLKDRIDILESLGVQLVIPLTFSDEFAALSAREFVLLLRRQLLMEGLVIGPDFALGRAREGDAHMLRTLGSELGFTVEVVNPLVLEGTPVSSTAIRSALGRGDMRAASRLLGRHFKLSGEVVSGTKRGHSIGFPTANISVESDQALPSNGVYATRAHLDGLVYRSVTSVGVRPTFDVSERTVEVFLMDFDEDIYGRDLSIELVARLRGEEKFASAEELSRQIAVDVQQAQAILDEIAGTE